MASLEIEVIMKLVILANKHSLYFGFRGESYKQVFGLAMGASLSPLLANLFLDSIETSAIHSFRLSLFLGADSWMMWFAFGNTV